MCKDLQKALLFFGIRSYYRQYKDRYTLQIRVSDTKKFLDIIGFMNSDKQEKGMSLYCGHDEHIFGSALIVESVEMTDDYVEMYDVCNTERGYYVANGVITHNTAADIYKQAVNNMFDRICTEGWLGKVLINGFIHDEMLIEVHKSINPYYFFKAWRREFQVEPKGYCKLFAGAGVGKCWYDAKKLDLPPLYIGEIIDKYHEDMEWDEDIEGFLADIKAEFKVHKTNRIKSYITDEKSQGEIIKPAISSLLGEEMDVILDAVSNDEEKINALNEILTESKLEVGGSNKIKGLQDQLKAFCYYYDIDYSAIDIKSVDDVVVPKNQEVAEEIFDEDEIDIPIDKEKLFMVGLVSNGIIVDYETQTVYMAEIKLKNKDGFIRGSSMLIQNMLLQKKDDESKYNSGYKIKYFGTIRTENPVGQIIPGYYVPRDNLPVLLDFYKTMLSKNFAYIM